MDVFVITRSVHFKGPRPEEVNEPAPDRKDHKEPHHKERRVEERRLCLQKHVVIHGAVAGGVNRLGIHPDPGNLVGPGHEDRDQDQWQHH